MVFRMPFTGEGDSPTDFGSDVESGVHYQRTRTEPYWSLQRLSNAIINENTTGDRTIIANVASQTIRIHGIFFGVNGANNIIFKSGGNTIIPVRNFAASDGGFFLPHS